LATEEKQESVNANTKEISRAIATLFQPNEVTEVRVPKSRKDGTISGYFDSPEKLTEAITELSGSHAGIYYTLNPTLESLTARAHNCCLTKAAATTTDDQIIRRRWLLIDVDPQRPAGISSSDPEKEKALEKLQEIGTFLTEQGWPAPVSADSGNGFHLLYRLDLPNTSEVTEAVKVVLKSLAERFDDDVIKVDRSVYNAARIVKAYGSKACKGQNTETRPHRLSRLRVVPSDIRPVTLTQLNAFKTLVQSQSNGKVVIKNSMATVASRPQITPEKIEEFLTFYGLEFRPQETLADGTIRWTLTECPFNAEHAAKDAAVFSRDGVLGFKCFHNSCQDNHWKEFRQHLESKTDKKFWFGDNLPEVAQASAMATSELNLVRGDKIKAEKIEWLWPGKVAIGKLTLFVGHPGIGKGLATMDLTARLTTGKSWPDCPNTIQASEVIIVSSEDAATDTLKPRLMAAGADETKYFVVETTKAEDKTEKIFSLDEDLPSLRKALVDNPNVKLVVIDPVMNHLGEINGNKEQEVRKVLTPLGVLAQEFKVAIILVAHFNKRSDVEAISRVGGAMAIVGCVRCAWTFTESRDDEETRLMLPLKANIAKTDTGIDYEIETVEVPIADEMMEIAHIKWGSESTEKASSALSSFNQTKLTKTDKACAWIATTLADGKQHHVGKLLEIAALSGHEAQNVQRAYKKLSGLKPAKKADGWYWQLPFAVSDPTPSPLFTASSEVSEGSAA
jgi:hypothetical protein